MERLMLKKFKCLLFVCSLLAVSSISAFASTTYKVDNNRSSFVNDAQAQYSLINYAGTIDFGSAGSTCVVGGILS